ncbi:uncharacterized protein LOC126291498 [Schistocerca gregaria]|uniref:uncharacterized protein LOC126291498 n=1 Tax=Schistocerca gregaria TaxID=7010 RepID=UPI00211DDE81|nr:uncharacterized protein LOC126291498 [Schistocerca gregaria]
MSNEKLQNKQRISSRQIFIKPKCYKLQKYQWIFTIPTLKCYWLVSFRAELSPTACAISILHKNTRLYHHITFCGPLYICSCKEIQFPLLSLLKGHMRMDHTGREESAKFNLNLTKQQSLSTSV